jgi:hypothetical protein
MEVKKMKKGIEWVAVGVVFTILIFFFHSQFHQRHLAIFLLIITTLIALVMFLFRAVGTKEP